MSIAKTVDLVVAAKEAGYAVPAVNIVDDLSLRAVVTAAEGAQSPVIIQTSVKTVKSIGAPLLSSIFSFAAQSASVPVALHLDHCPDRAFITVAVENGWSSVLFDASDRPLEQAWQETKEVVAQAHAKGVGVECEIENIVGVEDGVGSDEEGHSYSSEQLVEVVTTSGADMEEDSSIVVMGEDVHRLNGGSRGATKGLKEKFDDRVLGTPISEAAFSGLGGGLALDGRYYPVVELMYADFIWVAADQLFNQIGKARHMFGGDHDMPLLLRIKIGTGTGYGSQHSMDPAGILATSVGWRIIAPSTPLDYVGLVNAAMYEAIANGGQYQKLNEFSTRYF